VADPLQQGRGAFERGAWAEAYAQLSAAAGAPASSLDGEDLERLATSAYLAGRGEEAYDVWAGAYQSWVAAGEPRRAARCAFWIAFGLLNGGELARGGGWVDRAQRLLDEAKADCVEQGYLQYPVALQCIFGGDVSGAHEGFAAAATVGDRFGVPEITALARVGLGRCLIYMGDVEQGVALLDEAMVSIGAREVSPIAVGDMYCTVIDACQELFDLRRAQEWTAALSHWCESQPELVLYRGQCLVHRAELMQLRGAWTDAFEEAGRAAERMAEGAGEAMMGSALYLRAELLRLRGDFGAAEDLYRQATELGRDPQPGLALLRLAQGRLDAAGAAIRRVAGEAGDAISRARVLGPLVEILLACGDVAEARAAADELERAAAELDAPFVWGLAAQAMGSVLLAENDAAAALKALRSAWTVWREVDAPYEAARVRVLIAQACRALGDVDSAEMELDAARSVFVDLDALPDVARVDALSGRPSRAGGSDLTARELEVLALVAKGKTNRAIADELVVSEKTVASHLSHIFTKLGLSTRSAATAYAYEHGLA
jgi:ATP/maltotriose-dependent transcriptional regulator MalT